MEASCSHPHTKSASAKMTHPCSPDDQDCATDLVVSVLGTGAIFLSSFLLIPMFFAFGIGMSVMCGSILDVCNFCS